MIFNTKWNDLFFMWYDSIIKILSTYFQLQKMKAPAKPLCRPCPLHLRPPSLRRTRAVRIDVQKRRAAGQRHAEMMFAYMCKWLKTNCPTADSGEIDRLTGCLAANTALDVRFNCFKQLRDMVGMAVLSVAHVNATKYVKAKKYVEQRLRTRTRTRARATMRRRNA